MNWIYFRCYWKCRSCNGFHYILFNSTTSWQIRNWFKFRNKSQQIWCAWWQSREVLLKWATHMSEAECKLSLHFWPRGLCWGMHLHMQCLCYANKKCTLTITLKIFCHFHTYTCKSFSVWGHCLNGGCRVLSVYVGGVAISGKACQLGSHEGWPATSNADARMILIVVINITPWFMVVILISVVFLFSIGCQGAAAELSQWLAKNPKADL